MPLSAEVVEDGAADSLGICDSLYVWSMLGTQKTASMRNYEQRAALAKVGSSYTGDGHTVIYSKGKCARRAMAMAFHRTVCAATLVRIVDVSVRPNPRA